MGVESLERHVTNGRKTVNRRKTCLVTFPEGGFGRRDWSD